MHTGIMLIGSCLNDVAFKKPEQYGQVFQDLLIQRFKSFPAKIIWLMVLTTISLAMKPDTSATAGLQFQIPAGKNSEIARSFSKI